jgi:hypothetical protein
MNYSYAPAAAPASSNFFSGIFSKFWAVMLIILIVFVAIVIYYKTIGYYLEFGWKRIYNMILGGESVDVEIGGENGVDAEIKPMTAMPPPETRPSGMPGATPGESPFVSALEQIAQPRKEVFNVSRNIYTFNDASAVCAALNSELATYDEVKAAHENGADWCNYGWVKGQMAIYPTQKDTWEKLQKGSPEYRNACGKPGVNGGYFDNPELRFGVNCFGTRPPKNAVDELLASQVALPPSAEEIEFDKKVQKFREQMNTMTVLPFRRGQWSD